MTGKGVSEKVLVNRVMTDLVASFTGQNHVVFCDNYSSGLLVDMLFEKKIFLAGTIRRTAAGFPSSLKAVVPPRGSYVHVRKCGCKQYFVFNDRKVVSFVSNVFPERMDSMVVRLQHDGVMREQYVSPTPLICL